MKPLCIVQARIDSSRIEEKMLAEVGGKPLVWYATHAAARAFPGSTVVACPAKDEKRLARAITKAWEFDQAPLPNFFGSKRAEFDVLGRMRDCAERYRWHPDCVIVRVTPDDAFKDWFCLRDMAHGVRHPIEIGGEACTLGDLRGWDDDFLVGMDDEIVAPREHVGHLIAAKYGKAPPAPPGLYTIDTPEQLEEMRLLLGYVPD